MADIIQSTTQQFLDIFDITNNFVIMKDGTVSTILTVDAMNFGLLAEEEQDAIMYAYAGLLNSLNYTVQIIIQSQTKDVTSYLKVLQEQEIEAENETMRRRIRMYREFVGNLIHERNVLDKKFYVVIPATALEMGFLATSSILPGSKSFDISSVERSLIIEKAKNLLDPKRDHLIAQFARIGLFSRQLATQEIIQLFYIRYNPEAIEGQQIGESSSYSTPLVKASIQENFMNSAAVAPTPLPTMSPAPQTFETAASIMAEPVTQLEPVVTSQFGQPLSATPEPFETQPPAQTHIQPVPKIHIAETAPENVAPTYTPEPLNQPEQIPSMTTPAPQFVMPAAPVEPATPTEIFSADAQNPIAPSTTPNTSSYPTPIAYSTAPDLAAAPIQADLPPLPEI